VDEEVEIVQGLEAKKKALIGLFIDVLRQQLSGACACERSNLVVHPPKA
jgi:hypothetical protein